MITSGNLSDWVDLFLDRALSDADAKILLDCFDEDPELKGEFVDEVVFSAMCHGLSTNSEKEVQDVMETIRLGVAAPDVIALVMKDLQEQSNDLADDPELEVAVRENKFRRKVQSLRPITYGIAACLAVLFFVVLLNQDPEMHATFSRSEGAKWRANSAEFVVGSQVGNERLELLSGFAVFNFGKGVQVSIEGPAEFSAKSSTQLELTYGNVSAYVAPSGIGFQVITEHGTVTDLGTNFEVSVEKGGSTDVSVLEGVVTFNSTGFEGERQIHAGRGIRVNDTEGKVIPIEVSGKKLQNRRLEMLMGIRGKGGEIRIVGVRDIKRPQLLKTHQSLAVLPERQKIAVKEMVLANISKSGNYRAADLKNVAVELNLSGIKVDSFLIQLNPPTHDKGQDAKPFRFIGGVEFDRPILGIMTNTEEILRSNAQYGRPGVNYKGIVKGGLEFNDKLFLSEDRRTLKFDWSVSPLFAQSRDQIRVLVKSENSDLK